jgi:hypothetical protein
VGKVKHEVIGISNFEGLNLFRLVANLIDSRLNVIFSLHECFILGPNLGNNTRCVDVAFPLSPVDRRKLSLISGRLVEELEN